MDDPDVQCAFCDAMVDGVELAVDAGWEPSFWLDRTTESGTPICPRCQFAHLDFVNDEPTIKPGHASLIRHRQTTPE